MSRLTKKVVDSISADPNGRDIFIWDDALKGFGLKVTPAGTKIYVCQYRTAEGRSRRYTIGKHGSPWTCDQARTKAETMLADLKMTGADPMEAKAAAREALTVAELADLYLAEGPAEKPNKKASSWATDATVLKRHVVPLLGRKPARSVIPADIARM